MTAIALAFGLAIVAAAYAIGPVSGCHVNPAVSLAVFITGKLSLKDLIGYVIAQVAGAFAGSGILAIIVANSTSLTGFGANGYGELSAVGLNVTGAIITEIILSFRAPMPICVLIPVPPQRYLFHFARISLQAA